MTTSNGSDKTERPPPEQRDDEPRTRPRLTLCSDLSRGRLDGAWWPRSRDLGAELVELVGAVPEALGRIVGAAYSGSDWDRAPRRVEVGGSSIEVSALSDADSHLLILTSATRNLTLLVVPPDTGGERAKEAMLVAASPENQTSARDILVRQVRTDAAAEPEIWDDHGPPWWAPDPVPPSHRVRRGRTRGRAAPGRNRASAGAPATPVTFEVDDGVYTGHGDGGRMWRIRKERSGWRLEFLDAGDLTATNAGVHRTVAAAMAEANR